VYGGLHTEISAMSANSKKQRSGLSNNLIRYSVHVAVLAALAAGSAAVQAQEAPAAPADQPLQEVVVTGTMIKRANAETAEAVTVLKADTLKDQGISNVEQALSQLVANAPAINMSAAVGTFSGGGTYANLRDLGQGRTLVLLDGQRLANNANTGDAVDLSGIPFSAIEQVEVLREGASALYGSDAIAGVINFITKKNYQGAEVEGNFDRPQDNGGGSGQVDFTIGHGDLANDGYNVMLTGSYQKQQELRATQRDFSATGFNPAGGYTSTNNPGTWPGQFIDNNPKANGGSNTWQAGYPACAGNSELTTYFGNCSYRYSAATDLLPKTSEASGMLSITKALPANNQVQLQYFYTQSEVTGWSGPMFYEFGLDPASPYYPTAAQLTCSGGAANCTAPVDLANGGTAVWTDPYNDRFSGNINVEQRVLLTFSGTNAGWDYTTSLNYSKNTNDNRNVSGYPNEAVLASGPGGTLSDLINPFGPQSAAGQALIDSSYVNGVYALGEDTRWSVDGHANHELGDAFNSGTPATVAIGADFGGERFTYATTPYNDLVSAATGLTDSAVEGARQTQALYMELDLPILKSVDLDISDREDRYSDFGRTNNGKVSIRYQATSFLTFRGTASTGFRAPTLYDLYSPNFLAASSSGTMGSGNPYCGTTPPTAPFTAATCDTQGLGLFGGNRSLTPETSQNFDLGVIVSPIQDLGITLDYYRILLKNTIGAVPETAIYGSPGTFTNYYVLNNSGGLTPSIGEATSCHPYTQPTCGYILLTDANTGRVTTDGVDISIQYLQHTPIGTFHEDLEGTATTQYLLQQYNGGPLLNIAGWYNEVPTALNVAYKWQHNLRVDWTSPGGMFTGGLDNRYYSTYIDEFPDGAGNPRSVGSYSLVDGYVGIKPVDKLTLVFGIKNLLDRDPPFTNAYQNNFAAGYNSKTADPLGRNFYINVKYKIF
jgi:iron complex outermembrane receptor protein